MRVYMRVYMCGQITIRTQEQHTTGTQDQRNTGPPGKPEYIGIFADNEKKYKKS